MAIIKTSAIISEIRGTLGGNVFSSNKGGNYVRRYKKPTNRNTIAQQVMRTLFMTLSSLWRSLSYSQRAAWTTIATHYSYMNKLGESKILSGQQLYMKLNQQIQTYNQFGTITTFPLLETPAEPQTFPTMSIEDGECDIIAGQISLNNVLIDTLPEVPAGFGLVGEATQSLSRGIDAPQKGLFKAICSFEPTADLTDSAFAQNFYTRYNAIFGRPTVGSCFYVNIYLVSETSGEKSTVIRALYEVV